METNRNQAQADGPIETPIETEVKIPFREGAVAAAKLLESRGYRVTEPRTLQVDQLFDFQDAALRNSRQLLRVRFEEGSGSGAILTFKGPAASNSPHKSREELETRVESRPTLELILSRLGLVPSFRYEKYRTTYRLLQAGTGTLTSDGLVAVDETPIGVYLELEGPGSWIDGTAQSLGFMPSDYVTSSYAALYRQHLATHAGPPDMLFLEEDVRPMKKHP